MAPTTTPIDGMCETPFEAVREAFLSNFTDELDVGASVALAVGGRLVVDLWGGHLDAERTRPWERDTLVNVFSTTKTMSCLALLVCASRGLVDVDAPVARYWPGFEANGKDGVLVRHLLSHTAGVPAWDTPIAATDLYDWDKVTKLLAAQAPWWEPGWKSGYHAISQGNLVGEVVRTAVSLGIPVPAMSASLAYYDAYRSSRLPANLTQAQRDFFGAHTYRRTDKDGTFHTHWT